VAVARAHEHFGLRAARGRERGAQATLRRPGDPVATRSAILKVVDANRPPLRVFLGESPLGIARADYASRIALWEEWNDVSIEAQGSRQWAASTGSTDP
jgi:hypothetical protein